MPNVDIPLNQLWLFVGFISAQNFYLAIALTALVFLYFSYGLINNARAAIIDLSRPETRALTIAMLLFLFGGSAAGAYMLVDYSRTLASRNLTPELHGPNVVIRDIGVLQWNLPAGLTGSNTAPKVVFDVEASTTRTFERPFRQLRTNATTVQIPARYNRRLYWRVRAAILSSDAIFENATPVGNWSNVVETDHFASIYDRIMRTGLLRTTTSTNNFTGIYKFYAGKLFRGVEPTLVCAIAKSLSVEMKRKISVLNS